jgi:hypothetical protein
MKFDKIIPNMVLYDVHSYRMGNTCLRSVGVWTVVIKSIDKDKRKAVVSWNGNSPEVWSERELVRLKSSAPFLIRTSIGRCRRETMAERAARLKASNVEVHRAGEGKP